MDVGPAKRVGEHRREGFIVLLQLHVQATSLHQLGRLVHDRLVEALGRSVLEAGGRREKPWPLHDPLDPGDRS